MRSPVQHLSRCFVAGVVALLPIGGVAFTFVWLESMISRGGLAQLPFYFPGLGLLLALLVVYACGLFVTTFLGRWLWRRIDLVLERLPLLGDLYQSLKEVLGYNSSKERFFQGVVTVPCEGGVELGLVTGACEVHGQRRTIVFVPGSPNPANGRLVLVDESQLQRIDVRVAAALRTLVALGKTRLDA